MNRKVLLFVGVVFLVSVFVYFNFVKNTTSDEQFLIDNLENTNTTTSDVIECGSVDKEILTQYDYHPTEVEKEAIIKSLTCINQAIIECLPSSLVINSDDQPTNITVNGQEDLGCSVSIKKNTGETITCPLPPSYVEEIKNKFSVANYDATIISSLLNDFEAEISFGNKNEACIITN